MDRDIASSATRRAALQNSIAGYLGQGYRVVSQTDTTAQLVKPKSFSCLLAVVLFLLGVVPLIIYLLFYLASKDQQVYITVDEFGVVSGMGGTVAIPRYEGKTAPPISRETWGIILTGIGAVCLLIAVLTFTSRDTAAAGVCFLVPAVGCLGGGIFLLVKKPVAKAS